MSVQVRNNPSAMIKPCSIRVVESEGMPLQTSPQHLTYGNMYIKFNVKFPETLEKEVCEQLKSLMPASSPVTIDR